MTLQEIIKAVSQGKTVSYLSWNVIKVKDEYWVVNEHGACRLSGFGKINLLKIKL